MRFGTQDGRFVLVAGGRALDAQVASGGVFAVALNYRPHAAEAGYVAPAAPLLFTKFPSCITSPVATVELVSRVDGVGEIRQHFTERRPT